MFEGEMEKVGKIGPRKKRMRIMWTVLSHTMPRLTPRVRFYRDLEEVREIATKLSDRRMFQTEWPAPKPLQWELMPGVLTEQPEELAGSAERVPSGGGGIVAGFGADQ